MTTKPVHNVTTLPEAPAEETKVEETVAPRFTRKQKIIAASVAAATAVAGVALLVAKSKQDDIDFTEALTEAKDALTPEALEA